MIKKLLIIFTLLAMMFSVNVSAENIIKLYIDDKNIKTDVAPIIVNDRTLVPVRCIFETFDANVDWVESTRQVIISSKDGNSIIFTIDNKRAYFNNSIVTLDAAPAIIDGRTLVPVRFISEKLGYNVKWDGNTSSVYIYSPEKKEEPVKKTDTETATTKPQSSSKTENNMIITDISAVKNKTSTTVTIKASNFKKPEISTALSPSRCIIDFKGFKLKNGDSKIKYNQNKDVSEIRYAEHEDYSRIVIESAGNVKYSYNYGNDYMTVTITGNTSASDVNTNIESDNKKSDSKAKTVEGKNEKELIKVSNPVVVIDAGHGGYDVGAIGYDKDGDEVVRESAANLTIAKSIQRYLEANGINTVMTRSTDKALGSSEMADLVQRCTIANNAKATLFVSIHNNSFATSEATGTTVLYADTDNKLNYGVTSKQMASNILSSVVKATGLYNRGIENSPKMVVLYKTNMPSVLVECAFVSSPKDQKILTDNKKLDELGRAIANGIISTIKELP